MGEGLNNREERLHFVKCLIRAFKERGFISQFRRDFPRGANGILKSIEESDKISNRPDSLHQQCVSYLWGYIKSYMIMFHPPELTDDGADDRSSIVNKSSAIASVEVIKLIDMMSSFKGMKNRSKEAKASELDYIANVIRTNKVFENFLKGHKKYSEPILKCIKERNTYVGINTKKTIESKLT